MLGPVLATSVCVEYVDSSATFTFFTCYLNPTPYCRWSYRTQDLLLNLAHFTFLVSWCGLKELSRYRACCPWVVVVVPVFLLMSVLCTAIFHVESTLVRVYVTIWDPYCMLPVCAMIWFWWFIFLFAITSVQVCGQRIPLCSVYGPKMPSS
jgi:hypothetical protein